MLTVSRRDPIPADTAMIHLVRQKTVEGDQPADRMSTEKFYSSSKNLIFALSSTIPSELFINYT